MEHRFYMYIFITFFSLHKCTILNALRCSQNLFLNPLSKKTSTEREIREPRWLLWHISSLLPASCFHGYLKLQELLQCVASPECAQLDRNEVISFLYLKQVKDVVRTWGEWITLFHKYTLSWPWPQQQRSKPQGQLFWFRSRGKYRYSLQDSIQ